LLAESVAGVAPALVITAGYDPLVDEGKAYADRLEAAGVTTEYICYEDMIHGFIRLGKVIPDAQIAVKKCAQVLAKAFA
jgi:acetyl esterase